MSGRGRIYLAAAVTLLGMGGAGCLLMYFFHDLALSEIFDGGSATIAVQLVYGSLYGILTAFLLLQLLRLRIMKMTGQFFRRLLVRYRIRWIEVILVSVSAGVGEELLFRGGIQPWLGIWPTALLFVALHGYLDPRDKAVFLYGTVMLPVAAGLGYLYTYQGLWSAAAAHTLIDVILMANMLKEEKSRVRRRNEHPPV